MKFSGTKLSLGGKIWPKQYSKRKCKKKKKSYFSTSDSFCLITSQILTASHSGAAGHSLKLQALSDVKTMTMTASLCLQAYSHGFNISAWAYNFNCAPHSSQYLYTTGPCTCGYIQSLELLRSL